MTANSLWMERALQADLAAREVWRTAPVWAAFLGHQFVEFGFKALWLAENKEPPRTHNLIRLAIQYDSDVPANLLSALGRLNQLYYARYPDGVSSPAPADTLQKDLEVARQWMRRARKKYYAGPRSTGKDG